MSNKTAEQVSIPNLEDFFEEYGGLHDASIIELSWQPENRCLLVRVDDLNSNLKGLPEYPCRQPAVLIFDELQELSIQVDPLKTHRSRFYGVEVHKDHSKEEFYVKVQVSPSGSVEIICKGLSLELLRE